MNYALDALWWRLKTPVVRDLASLLTAPPPWHSGHELPVATLLGTDGFRYLLALDKDAAPLCQYLQSQPPDGQRLGRYAERLLAFWLSHAPHTALIWKNMPLSQQGQTLAELDFLARIDGQLFHIELACKYYGSQSSDINQLVGLNAQDRWQDKALKLQQQLSRLSMPEAQQQALDDYGLKLQMVQSVSVLRGMIFTHNGQPLAKPPLNHLGWTGLCVFQWSDLLPYLSELTVLYRFGIIDKTAWLSPHILPFSSEQALDWPRIQQIQQGMVALMVGRADGYWHEVQRIMKMTRPD
ncbi:DUF1853 family protein [Neisseriaceae bacterium ESL0693]|nr:DUF1853 family protein [Neisseriaceae bacterium ESL0693]